MRDKFDVKVQKKDDYAIMYTDGYLNQLAGEKLKKESFDLIDKGYVKIVINLQKTGLVNSVGISILIDIIERLREEGGVLHFCCLTPLITKTFRIMGLTQFSSIFSDERAAVSSLPGS